MSVPEGLTLGASGLVSRQMKRGERASVPASRTFAETLNVRPADAPLGDCGQCAGLTAGPKIVCHLPQKSLLELVEALHETENYE